LEVFDNQKTWRKQSLDIGMHASLMALRVAVHDLRPLVLRMGEAFSSPPGASPLYPEIFFKQPPTRFLVHSMQLQAVNTLLGLLDCQRLWTGQSVSPSFQPKVLSRVLRCSSSKQKPTDAYLISHLELRENVLGRQIRPLQRELYLLVDRLPYGYGSGGYTHSRPGANGVAQIFGGGQL
jgi:hypothetical protein